jgi:sugar lactone lactonase YvrE
MNIDSLGNIYVIDTFNHRIVQWNTSATVGELVAGGNGGGSNQDQFNTPRGFTMDSNGNYYISDTSKSDRFHLSSSFSEPSQLF